MMSDVREELGNLIGNGVEYRGYCNRIALDFASDVMRLIRSLQYEAARSMREVEIVQNARLAESERYDIGTCDYCGKTAFKGNIELKARIKELEAVIISAFDSKHVYDQACVKTLNDLGLKSKFFQDRYDEEYGR